MNRRACKQYPLYSLQRPPPTVPAPSAQSTDRAIPSERRSDDSTVETDIEVLTFHAAALSNNPSTTNPHIKQNAQPHGNTTKISHSNHLTNHPSQNNQFSAKSDYITQPYPSIPPNKPRNWSNQTHTPSDKLVGPFVLTNGKNEFFIVLVLVHSLRSFAPK